MDEKVTHNESDLKAATGDNSKGVPDLVSDYLEPLFLVAQFVTRDADQAAVLVDRVVKTTSSETGVVDRSLPALIERMLWLSESSTLAYGDDSPAPHYSNHARKSESDRFLSRNIRLEFLLLGSRERLELWRCVEQGGSFVSGDALDAFHAALLGHLTPEEKQVFGDLITRESVAHALRGFWNSAFVPVPPTLRSVVESVERRRSPDDMSPKSSQQTVRSKKKKTSTINRVLLYAWVILAAGAVGFLLTRAGEPEPPSNDILELSRSVSENVDITFQTGNAEQAERFIADRFGWRLSTPEISQASLIGISLAEILDSVELPVLVFNDNANEIQFPVFTFSYAFLEKHSDQFGLGRGTLRQIQNSAGFDVHEFRDTSAVVWRHQDDIFVAFIVGDGNEFQARVMVRS